MTAQVSSSRKKLVTAVVGAWVIAAASLLVVTLYDPPPAKRSCPAGDAPACPVPLSALWPVIEGALVVVTVTAVGMTAAAGYRLLRPRRPGEPHRPGTAIAPTHPTTEGEHDAV